MSGLARFGTLGLWLNTYTRKKSQSIWQSQASPPVTQAGSRSSSGVSEVIGSLGEDGMQKYAEMAKSWNETEPPEEIQRK